MNRDEIFTAIAAERNYQDSVWGTDFDDKNTPNDWVSYFPKYIARACTVEVTTQDFRSAMIKTAALAVAALEALERNDGELIKRHYD
jgi:hypothetical protein